MTADLSAMTWDDHQKWEAEWWGDCTNTFGEEAKQLTYAHRMGLVNEPRDGRWPVYDLGGRSVMDIGGGPSSILLKCVPVPVDDGPAWRVFDPCSYPDWVAARYQTAGIDLVKMKGEDITGTNQGGWDEAWIYNVLQHTADPALIAENACRSARTVRVFEWVDTPPEPGHPHTLTAEGLAEWFGVEGTVETFTGENGLYGTAWYGAFNA